MSEQDNRRVFLRHPSDVPIDFDLAGVVADEHEHLVDISAGGLSFHALRALPVDALITVRIPVNRPQFAAVARVVRCVPEEGRFQVGVAFLQVADGFRARMAEQVCHIEQYKREVREREGRELTGTQAALEWIGRHAADFPQFRP
ncbi:MAG TPA: PilZ domain-containing protein [bacterium]|nr:PilZ domain-containing protein [bacterium]